MIPFRNTLIHLQSWHSDESSRFFFRAIKLCARFACSHRRTQATANYHHKRWFYRLLEFLLRFCFQRQRLHHLANQFIRYRFALNESPRWALGGPLNCIVTSHTSVKSFREIRHALCWSLSTREFYYKNKLFLFPHECIRSLSRYCLVLCVLDQVEVNFRHDFPILNENLINNGTAEFDTRLFSIITIHAWVANSFRLMSTVISGRFLLGLLHFDVSLSMD